MEGWIKLHRKMVDWEWYNDNNTKILFIHLLLTANHKEKNWQGHTILRGQKITSLEHLAKETNLSVQQIRTSLSKLKSTNEITIKTTNKNTLVTILKYSDYQDKDEENNKQDNTQFNNQITNEQQTNNKQITTNKNDKNEKNDKNDKNDEEDDIIKCYEENIGMLTPASAEKIFSYLDELNSDMIIQAIKKASINNKKSTSYIQGILNSWIRKGYKTLIDIEQEQNIEKKEEKSFEQEVEDFKRLLDKEGISYED